MHALMVMALVLGQDYAPTRMGTDALPKEQEDRVQRLGKQLRCAVCQGVAISDSPASMARAQLDKVRELVAAGKSDDEIFAFFVDRYGEWILLEPRKTGLNGFLWFGPVVLLLGGLLFIFLQARKDPLAPAPQTKAPAPAPEAKASVPADDAFLAQVRADLEK
jgi:cytochrome c-type biogenesis protein CcmH